MGAWRNDRLGAAARGENPTVLGKMRSGWAVIGDTQHLPGYCLLLYAGQAARLENLSQRERVVFLADMALLGEAVATVCSERDPEFSRINYSVMGNTWPHLHAHVQARYTWEPEPFRSGPVWQYPDRNRPEHALSQRHASLREALTREIRRVVS